jgi:hypothetical protein
MHLSLAALLLQQVSAYSIPWLTSDETLPPANWTVPVSYPLNSSIRAEILKKFSPVIYLHPEEAYLPTDPSKAYAQFLNSTSDELSVPDHLLDGDPAKYDQDGRPYVDAPITAQARVLEDGRVALQYWYYHHLNGAQGFKTVTSSGRVTRFPWYPLAVHYADWEHTTIVLSNEYNPVIESVYYTVHADINEPQYDYQVEDKTHALVYSHNNSHACYKTPDDVQNTDPAFDGFINSAVRAITFGAITHIEVGDIGFSDFPKNEWIRWADYDLYDITDAHEGTGPTWAIWAGHWGPAFDQSMVDMPPKDVPWRRFFFTFLQMLYHAGRLTKFVVSAKISPRGPTSHYTWATFDIYDPPAKYIPEDPNGHKPDVISILAFIYFLLGFVGMVNVVISLLCILIVIILKKSYISARKYIRASRQRRREMSERTPLL